MKQELKLKELEVRDGRVVAKFLVKTGLKKTLFTILFPKDNPNLPKNWMDLRKHLQTNYGFSDKDFKDFKAECNDNLYVGLNKYVQDFPSDMPDNGELIIDLIVELFADDKQYDALMELFAYLFQVEAEVIQSLTIAEVITLVKSLLKDSGFLALWQPSTPLTSTVEETQV